MIDHLVLATPDVDATATWLAEATGVQASVGGPHVGRGTKNRLCSFGADHYLEIIGPDPDQPEPDRPRGFGIDDLTAPALVTWCAKVDGLPNFAARAADAGLAYTAPRAMQRQAPTGLLSWTLAHPEFDTEAGIVPFCIDWADTPHPALVAEPGLTLVGLRAEHPEPGRMATLLASLGFGMLIDEAARPGLRARVSGPLGQVDLPRR